MSEITLSLLPLAQTVTGSRKPGIDQATWWLAGLLILALALFIAAGIVIYVIRSRAFRSEATASDIPLTLAEVRRMHQSGEIDDDEMRRLKKIVTGQAKRGMTEPAENKGE